MFKNERYYCRNGFGLIWNYVWGKRRSALLALADADASTLEFTTSASGGQFRFF
jgi:hypothetical protein